MNFFSYERQVCDSESYHIPAFILLYEKIIDKFSFWVGFGMKNGNIYNESTLILKFFITLGEKNSKIINVYIIEG